MRVANPALRGALFTALSIQRRHLRRTPPVFMPEGPEVRLHAEELCDTFTGSQLVAARICSGRYVSEPPRRWELLQQQLPATVEGVHCKGKLMWWELTGSAHRLWLFNTLGMTGGWSRDLSPHSRVELRLSDASGEARALYFNDMRNFGTLATLLEEEVGARLDKLGPSWLQPGGLDLQTWLPIVEKQCKNKRSRSVPVARFLMDQSKTSGIGNYLLSEVLHLARIWPWATCGDLDEADWVAVHAAASQLTATSFGALHAGATRGAAVEDADEISPTRGRFGFQLHVYRRSATPDGLAVRRSLGPHGRSIFWAAELQLRGLRHDVDADPGGVPQP